MKQYIYVDVTDRSGQKRTLSVGVEAYDDSWSLDGVDAFPRSASGTLSDWSSASSVNFSRNAFTSGATAFEIFLDVKYPNGKQPSFAAEVHASGWYTSGGSWHYSYSSGIDATGWAYINGSWYYFNGSGVMQTGWLNLGGKSYYLDPSFGRMATGFDAGSCFDPDGSWLCYSGGASSALRIARSVGSPTNCLLLIDNSRCTTWVFKWVNGDLSAIHKWICSPGKASMPTVRGTYSIGLRGYSFGNGFTCYYWTQFYGNYLFHSILYYQGTRSVVDGTLGVPASHGCVRLDINNAYWINQNIPSGTRVYSY